MYNFSQEERKGNDAFFLFFPKRKEVSMIQMLREMGRRIAEEFVESGQDLFVMTADVEGEQVTVTVKFSPKEKKITNEDVWKCIQNSNMKLI